MKKIVLLQILVFSASFVVAGGGPNIENRAKTPKMTERTSAQPDIPGTFIFDIGFNFLQNNEAEITTSLFGSRTLNLYYFYEQQIGQSKFFVLPGIGMGFDRYKFDQDITVTTGNNAALEGVSKFDFIDGGNVKKSMLIANYLDLPIEFRYVQNPNAPKRSFKVGLGLKVGVLVNSHTKIKQELDGRMQKFKVHDHFYLNKFRYGATVRAGFGGFNIFYYQSLNTIFENDKGPFQTEINNTTVGISFTGF